MRRSILRTSVLVAVTLLLGTLAMKPVEAAATMSANFTAGGALNGGVRFARHGDALTLTVTTPTGIACVEVPGAMLPVQVDGTEARSTWTFDLTAASGDGPATVTASAYPKYNSNQKCTGSVSGTTTASYTRDNTAPSLSGAPTAGPNGAGWYGGDVSVAWTATDAGSGIEVPPANSTVTGEGSNLSATTTVADRVGNQTTQTVSGIRIDRTSPLTTAAAPTTWQKEEVTVRLSASDNLSGVASTEYRVGNGDWQTGTTILLNAEGRHTVSFRSTDIAGNTEDVRTVTVDLDKTAPSISATQDPEPNLNGWNKTDVTVTFACTDELSGIADVGCTEPQEVTVEGEDTPVTGTATDNAGNSSSMQHLVSIDKTAPTIGGTVDRPANEQGWYAADVVVTFTCSDDRSGVVNCPEAETLGEGAEQSVSRWAFDFADNSAEAAVSGINVDKTVPTITYELSRQPNAERWHNEPVTVTFSCEDELSGIDGDCPDPVTFGEGTDQTATGTVSDLAGNTASVTVEGIDVDLTLPTITGQPDRAPDHNGWYTADVEVSFACDDPQPNGVASGVDECPSAVTLGEGAGEARDGQSVTGSVRDRAGNSNSATVSGIKVDKTPPSTTADPPTGWGNEAVTVTLTPSDSLSGVAMTEYSLDGDDWTTGRTVELGEGRHTLQYRSVDHAGNVEEVNLAEVDIDLSAPEITSSQHPAKNGAGWNNSDVAVSFTCDDTLSGLKSCTEGSSVSDEGETSVLGTAEDNAGNTNSFTHTVKIDKTKPAITGERTPANDHGWNNDAVSVTFTCEDHGSGVKSCAGDQTLDHETDGASVTGTATDNADNTDAATVSDIKIDKTPPTITARLDGEPVDGWHGEAVTVSFECGDALSGLEDGACPAAVTLRDGEAQSVTRSVEDRAGNSASVTMAGINVDTDGPAVVITSPTGGSTTTHDSVTITGKVSDLVSGVDSVTIAQDAALGVAAAGQSATVEPDGTFSAILPLGCGQQTFSAVATDVAGHSNASDAVTVTRTCASAWTATGFHQPVGVANSVIVQHPGTAPVPGSQTAWNVAKGGATVPLKFNVFVNGVERTDREAVTGFSVAGMTCPTSTTGTDDVEFVTSGSTGLRYDTVDKQFVQNWKTPSVSKDSCYRTTATLADGTTISAFFRLRK